jgi:integrase
VEDWLTALDVDVRTEENYSSILRCHIFPRWGDAALVDVSGIQVAAWTKDLSKRLAPATVAGILKLFTMILVDAVIERHIAYNPIQPRRRGRRIRARRRPERIWATPDEVVRAADQAAACYHPSGAMLILTAAWTGARWGELTGLHRDNLILDENRIVIDPDRGSLHEGNGGNLWLGPPKTESSARTISLPDFLVPLLRRHLETVKSQYVFVTPDGYWHRRSNFSRRAVRPAADGHTYKSAEPDQPSLPSTVPVKPGLTFHGLRHSHKTWMIADAVPEVAQSRRLGHVLQNPMQETYSHVAVEVEQRLLAALNDRWEKAVANTETSDLGSSYRRLMD